MSADLGRSATRWLLRAVYLREQFITGAIQLPDQIVARIAGMSVRAVKKTRTEWVKAGLMARVADGKPATYTLSVCPEAYRADLDRFNPTKRKRRTMTRRPGR